MHHFKQILVAIDLYDMDESALQRAMTLAKAHHAELSIVHVSPPILTTLPYADQLQKDMDDEASIQMQDLVDRFKLQGARVFLEHGSPKQEITRVAETIKADLIIVGSHGKHGFGLLLGSTANGVLHLAKTDVLTVRIDAKFKAPQGGKYRTIVVATDFSEDSEQVIKTAKDLVEDYNAELHVVAVVPDMATLASMYVPDVSADVLESAKQNMRDLVARLGLKAVHYQVVRGNTTDEILHYATETAADLIVVGSHERGLLGRTFIGSTANAVLHGARQDVYVVHLPGRACL